VPGEDVWPTQPIPHTARGVPQIPFCATYPIVKDPELAKRVRDEFFPKSLVDPDAIKGVDSVMKEAVNLKFISEPLTQKQLDELIQIPPRKM